MPAFSLRASGPAGSGPDGAPDQWVMERSGFSITIEGDVLARAKDGDVAAMSGIYRSFSRQVYSLGMRICQDGAEAEDVLQDTFLEVFQKLGQYRADAPFWFWLRQVAVNKALLRIRQRRHWAAELELVKEEGARDADPDVEMDLERLLGRLSAAARTVLLLHDVEGYTHREIAELLGKTESFSKSQLSRAHEKLRKWLKWGNSRQDNIRQQRY